MILPIISTEQNNVIQQLILNNNVVVDSVAGSGKTTCNLHIAKYFNDMNILLLTYNSKLKIETREKIKKIGLHNIEVHSYHSFCVKYYDKECFNDTNIINIIKNKKISSKKFKFDLIILDESQDISSLYYEVICKIYKDNNHENAKICIFGDQKQSIFVFNNADQRFIEYAPELFNFNSYNWVRCNLSISFRITYEMSLFINKCLLHKDIIVFNKITNNKPRYIVCDCFGDKLGSSSRTFNEVKYYLNLGYKPNDIFILAPSLKSFNSPVRQLENKIKNELSDVMVYVPTGDDEKLDEELLQGKMVFSTFHQTKGLERKVVIIFNFDSSYFTYYKREANPCICSNELYVATTRAIEHLTLFHHNQNNFFNFINKDNISQYCYFEDSKIFTSTIVEKNFDTSVTDVIKFLPQNIIDECFDKLEIIPNDKYIITKINIPLKTSNNETTESVSEITGIAIPSMFELKLKNKIFIYDFLFEKYSTKKYINNESLFSEDNDQDNSKINNFCENKNGKIYNIDNINIQNIKPDELLYISNLWNAYKTGYIFKIFQISNYNWLEQKKLDECIKRLSCLNISVNSSFEYNVEIEKKPELLNRKLLGYIDCVDEDNNIVYEFKCVQKLEKEHYLQLAIYMYIYETEKINLLQKINDYCNDNINLINENVLDLLNNREKIVQNIIKNEKILSNSKNNIIYEKTDNYSIGDIIKYIISDEYIEEIGEIIKIYKTTGKVKIKNNFNKNIDIKKTSILGVKKNIDLKNIQVYIEKLNNDLIIINNNIDEKNENIKNLKSKLDKYVNKQNAKYVLFNILNNEYIEIKCEYQKLVDMIKYLVYSKYINNKITTNENFIINNNKIKKMYFPII